MGSNQTTMIGSLPSATPREALDMLARSPLGIPAWPQLPKRSFREGMIAQFTEGFPGIMVDEQGRRIWVRRDGGLLDAMSVFFEAVVGDDGEAFAVSPDHAAGLHAFLADLQSSGRRLPIVKGQVTGPFTLGLGLNDSAGTAVWFDEQYREVVLAGLAKKAVWQVLQLHKVAGKVLLFLDEPIFAALGTPAYLGIDNDDIVTSINAIAGEVHAAGADVGVHCCGNMEWSLFAKTSIDVISFDAYSFGDRVALYPREIGAFLERGGILAWGIVPTDSSETVSKQDLGTLIGKLRELEDGFTRRGIPPTLLRRQRILTPSCGLGNLSAPEAQRVLDLLSQLAEASGSQPPA